MTRCEHELGFARSFLSSRQGRRFATLSEKGDDRSRAKLLNMLCHDLELNEHAELVPTQRQNVSDVLEIVRRYERAQNCYAISLNKALDEKCFPFEDALTETLGQGAPSILSITPGRLAYYEGEELCARYILHRPDRAGL